MTKQVMGTVAMMLVCCAAASTAWCFSSRNLSGAVPVASASPTASASPAASAWIYRADGALSCSPDSGQSLAAGAEELKQAGVQVLQERKTNDGQLHIQMCGVPKGSRNSYLVPAGDVEKAERLGFRRQEK